MEYFYPNLAQMILSNRELHEDSSFYWYSGSDSKPPCDEGYTRYMMKQKALIGSDQFNTMKKQLLVLAGLKTPSNVRVIQDRNEREVFFHNACTVIDEAPLTTPDVPDYKFIKAT